MTGYGAGGASPSTARRAYLDRLVVQLDAYRLVCRHIGDGEDLIVRVINPRTGAAAHAVCVPTMDRWLYLWSRGGQRPADDPAGAAEQIARSLS